ncbi:MAG: arginine--tRNA ligase [Coriobacteriaceae bacterium]|nr:arginine--tRNA ligase [Coriobacteriaceae bacterium]
MRKLVEDLVTSALSQAVQSGELALPELPAPSVERPRDLEHGDWATSVALKLAKQAHMNPRQIAEIIASHMESPAVERIEVAGPGFINVKLADSALQDVFKEVRAQDAAYGRTHAGDGVKVDLEFISANPTGPMHLGHGRWAALGDAMANVLSFAGYDVTREFYINDAGNQMNVFADSVSHRYLQVARLVAAGSSLAQAHDEIVTNMDSYRAELPENCYAGAYIVDIAARIFDSEGDAWVEADEAARDAHFKEVAYTAVLDHVKALLHSFGLDFDVWYSERTTYAKDADGSSRLSRALDALREGGYLYEKEGAVWFRTTDFGDDKDRVLVKADGSYTYFAPDIAYHKNKLDRGFDRCIDILGADHHGYIKRIQSVGHVFGHPGQPEVVIGQMVNLFRDGVAVRMSKRTGEMVTFEELIDEVGVDATRYLMLSRSTDQTIDFDIAQAKKQDSSNPVYYVQYAHARICSLLRKAAAARGISEEQGPDALAEALIARDADLSVLVDDAELALARKIDEFPELAAGCARDLAPFRITHYAQDLASTFHQFYTQCHVLTDDDVLTAARLFAADATRRVLRNALGLLGVSAPEKM